MVSKRLQPMLPFPGPPIPETRSGRSGTPSNGPNGLYLEDRRFHDWYRFVLSFPPHLVRQYIADFGLGEGSTILDPFCGTGTTIVEAKLNRVRGIGLEANPFPCFATAVKTDWSIDPDTLLDGAKEIAQEAGDTLHSQGIDDDSPLKPIAGLALRDLDAESKRLLIGGSISPLPLHKTLVFLDSLNSREDQPYFKHALLALGKALVTSVGNLRFGPEVGVGKIREDAPVIAAWMNEVQQMATDLRSVQAASHPTCDTLLSDARRVADVLPPRSVDAVITSPPYPNEKDYTRTTRLESVVLGFYKNPTELRDLKRTLLRSNTRHVYQADDDDRWIAEYPEIERLAERIEARRLELGKTSGFEKLNGRVTKRYFGGMARHLMELRHVLRPGAQLAYVVGDQASYLRVMIRTGQLLAEIAEQLGYEFVRIDLFRTRFATATQDELREEVVVLRWPG
jgi:DNA modification methylase